jgi:hypothetical protein
MSQTASFLVSASKWEPVCHRQEHLTLTLHQRSSVQAGAATETMPSPLLAAPMSEAAMMAGMGRRLAQASLAAVSPLLLTPAGEVPVATTEPASTGGYGRRLRQVRFSLNEAEGSSRGSHHSQPRQPP